MAKGDGGNNGGGGGGKVQPGVTLNLPMALDSISDKDNMARVATVAAGVAVLAPCVFYGFKVVSRFLFGMKPGEVSERPNLGAADPRSLGQAMYNLATGDNPKQVLGAISSLKGCSPELKADIANILGLNNSQQQG